MAAEAIVGAVVGAGGGMATAWAIVAKSKADSRTATAEAAAKELTAKTTETQAVIDGWKDMAGALSARMAALDERALMQDRRIDHVQEQADKCDQERAVLTAQLAAAGVIERRTP